MGTLMEVALETILDMLVCSDTLRYAHIVLGGLMPPFALQTL